MNCWIVHINVLVKVPTNKCITKNTVQRLIDVNDWTNKLYKKCGRFFLLPFYSLVIDYPFASRLSMYNSYKNPEFIEGSITPKTYLKIFVIFILFFRWEREVSGNNYIIYGRNTHNLFGLNNTVMLKSWTN